MPRRRYDVKELQEIAASFGIDYVPAEAALSVSTEDFLRRIEVLEASGAIHDPKIVAAVFGGEPIQPKRKKGGSR